MNQFRIVCNRCDEVIIYIKRDNPVAKDIAMLKLHAQTCKGVRV